MRMAELRKETAYALNKGWSSHPDLRESHDLVKVEYVGPEPAKYDRYRPTQKLNAGIVLVKALEDLSHKNSAYKTGDVFAADAKQIVVSWDSLLEIRGASQRAHDQMSAYFSALKHLLVEVDPDVLLTDSNDWHYQMSEKPEDKARTVHVHLYTTENHTQFDPVGCKVELPVELFRKLLQAVKV